MRRTFIGLALAVAAAGGATAQASPPTPPPYEILPYSRVETLPQGNYYFRAAKIDRQNKKLYACFVTADNHLTNITGYCSDYGGPENLPSSYVGLLPVQQAVTVSAFDLWLISNTTGAVSFCIPDQKNKLQCIDLPVR